MQEMVTDCLFKCGEGWWVMNQEWQEERHSENEYEEPLMRPCIFYTGWDNHTSYGPPPSPSLQESRHLPPSSHHPTKLPPCVACLPTNRRFAVNTQPRRRPSSATRCRVELQRKGCWLTLSPPIQGSFFFFTTFPLVFVSLCAIRSVR